jgi:hypothetical protein
VVWQNVFCKSTKQWNNNLIIIREKATTVALKLGTDNFKASKRWLDRFQKHHGQIHKTIYGESVNVDEDTAEYWKTELLQRHLEGYKPKDTFNVDETVIFFLKIALLENYALGEIKAKEESLVYCVQTWKEVKSCNPLYMPSQDVLRMCKHCHANILTMATHVLHLQAVCFPVNCTSYLRPYSL